MIWSYLVHACHILSRRVRIAAVGSKSPRLQVHGAALQDTCTLVRWRLLPRTSFSINSVGSQQPVTERSVDPPLTVADQAFTSNPQVTGTRQAAYRQPEHRSTFHGDDAAAALASAAGISPGRSTFHGDDAAAALASAAGISTGSALAGGASQAAYARAARGGAE